MGVVVIVKFCYIEIAAGHAVLACGEAVRPRATVAASLKHEPSERAAQAA